MGFRLSSAISIARGITHDTDATGYRVSNDKFVELGNGALRSLANIRPEWFLAELDFTCAAGAEQTLTDAYQALVNVKRIKNGSVVLPADKASLDAFMPTWMSVSGGAAQNWLPYLNAPRRFFLYPPALSSQVLEVTAVKVPGPYLIDEDTGIPEMITDAVADYMVGMAESADDEFVLSQRATQFLNQFAARVGTKG